MRKKAETERDLAGASGGMVVYKKRNSYLNKDTWRRFSKNRASMIGLNLF